MFKNLLTFTNHADHDKTFPSLLHSQIENLLKSLKHDFPDVIQLSSIGKTWQKKEQTLMTVDGSHSTKKKNSESKFLSQMEEKDAVHPAIVLTG